MSTSRLRIPSPAHSQGAMSPLRHRKLRRTHSMCSATSNTSVSLTAIISDSYNVSPLPNRQSVLNDDTEIEMPGCRSWWKRLSENSKDVNEILKEDRNKNTAEVNKLAEEFNLEIFSHEKENYTLDLPEYSDSESIHSIVMPKRQIFNQQNNQQKKKFKEFINYKETTAKMQTSQIDKDIDIRPKKLFNQVPKQKAKSTLSSALVSTVSNITINKTTEKPSAEVKGQVRNLFGNRAGTKRKNIYTEFIVSESEDEIPEIQPKLFEFKTRALPRHRESLASQAHSSTSNVTDIEIDDWKHVPSSTMVENQFDSLTPTKRPRLRESSTAKDCVNMNVTLESEQLKEVENLSNLSATSHEHTAQHQSLKQLGDKELSSSLKASEGLYRSKRNKNINNNESLKETSINLKGLLKNIQISDDVRGNQDVVGIRMQCNNEKENVHQDIIGTISQVTNRNVSTEQGVTGDNDDDGNNLSLQYEDADEEICETIACVVIANQDQNLHITDEERNEEQEKITEEMYSNQDENFMKEIENKDKSVKSNIQPIINEKSKIQIENQTIYNFQNNVTESANRNESTKENNEIDKNEKESNIIIEGVRCDQKDSEYGEFNKSLERETSTEHLQQNSSIQDINLHIINNITMENQIKEKRSPRCNEENNFKIVQELEQQSIQIVTKTKNINEEKNKLTQGELQKEQNICSPVLTTNVFAKNTKQNESIFKAYEFGTADKIMEQHNNEQYQHNSAIENKIMEQDQTQNEIEYNKNESNVGQADAEEEESEIEKEYLHESTIENEIEEPEGQTYTDQELNNSDIENNEDEEHTESEDEHTESEDEHTESENQHTESDDEHLKSEDEQNESYIENEIIEEKRQYHSEQDQNVNNIENNYMEEETGEESYNRKLTGNEQHEEDEHIVDNQVNNNITEYNQIVLDKGKNSSDVQIDETNFKTQVSNIYNDTTEKNRKKNNPSVQSPEAVLYNKTHQETSFTAPNNKTSIRKSKTMLNQLHIRASLRPDRESAGLTDGTVNSSAEGSGWDSHRTTRKTLRQTFGKDFTPRKSLRALVMEKSAKRQTNFNDVANTSKRHTNFTVADITKLPAANSTRLPQGESYRETDSVYDDESIEESDHEASRQLRQTKLEMYLQKVKKDNAEMRRKMHEDVMNSLYLPGRETFNAFKIPEVPKPARRTLKPVQKPSKEKTKQTKLFSNDMLPAEFFEDLKYKPPKRFQGKNAPWITKRLYKYLEDKLTPKYSYAARVRAERLVETLYRFARETRRSRVAAAPEAVRALKLELARLQVVRTHYDFYNFFHEFMPREIRIRVNPDVMNKIPAPKNVFSDIIPTQES